MTKQRAPLLLYFHYCMFSVFPGWVILTTLSFTVNVNKEKEGETDRERQGEREKGAGGE